MDIVTAALVIILVFILFLMTRPDAEKSRIQQLLNKLPGPPTYPIFGTAWELTTSPVQRHAEIFSKYNKKYGPVYRGWLGSRGSVTVASPEAAEIILGSTVHINKSVEYSVFNPWLGDSLLQKKGQEWRKLRKLVSPAFSPSTLEIYSEVFNNNSEILVQTLMTKVSAGEFDVCPYVNLYTLDCIIGYDDRRRIMLSVTGTYDEDNEYSGSMKETGLGFKLNMLKNGNMTYVNALHNIVKRVGEEIQVPWLPLKYIFDPSGLRKKYNESLAFCHQFVENIFGIRVGDNDGVVKKSADFLMNDIHISEVQKKNKDTVGILIKTVGKELIKDNIHGIIFAAHDTTSSGLSWAIQLLGEHTDVQEKVYEEMTRIFDSSDRRPTKEDLEQMKYLERVIKETLRLYPSASAVGRQTETDVQIGQYTIPAGVSILIHIYCLHRNPECYPNPEEFNPDNFLPERIRDRHPYAFIPFSAGPRRCLGQKYAIMEMKTALSAIIRNFKIKSNKKTKDLQPVFGVTTSVHGGVHVELTLRGKE